MNIKFFKQCQNQSKVNMSISEELEELVIGTSVDEIALSLTGNRKLYRAVRTHMNDFGEGFYFAGSYGSKYIFAFITKDFSKATVTHKIGKGYVAQKFYTTRRTDKTWIFEVDTMMSKQVNEDNIANIEKIDINKIEDLSIEELRAALVASVKASKEKDEVIAEQAEIIEAQKEEIEKITKKSNKHFAISQRKSNQIEKILDTADRGVNPAELRRIARSLQRGYEFSGMDTIISEADIFDMENL